MLQGESDDSPRHLCYGCGSRNPEGLHIHFDVEGRRVTGRFTAREVRVAEATRSGKISGMPPGVKGRAGGRPDPPGSPPDPR